MAGVYLNKRNIKVTLNKWLLTVSKNNVSI